jgi:DNA recombination protein RmuC
MLEALLLLSAITLLAVLALLFRKPAPPAQQDPRLGQLTDSLPSHLARLEATTAARLDTLDAALHHTISTVHAELAATRRDAAADAGSHRDAINQSALHLRDEITRILTHLGGTLTSHLTDHRDHSASTLGAHRTDTAQAAEALRAAVRQDLDAINGRLSHFIAESGRHQADARDALHTRLNTLGDAQTAHQERLRSTVEDRLNLLNTTNAAKLEEMRATVDEKLHATLHTRLSESFGQVTDQLSKVHSGLGEMSKLSEGVDGLSRIFTNVKSRGGFAEVQLGMLLEQMLAPSQFVRNARIKPRTNEVVEFAVRFPGHTGETLLPIDAKFPREDFERLEHAYESGSPTDITAAGRAFEAAIRTEGKRICEKYIEQPVTTPYAIMFLPTEGLYAEVMRREGLQAELQSKCHVTIAGPSTLSAILSSFQMGFHMLAIQQKGDEVWKVLGQTRSEFGKFEKLVDSMEKQVGTVQNSIQSLGVRTRAINRTLRDVGELDAPTAIPSLRLEDTPANILPLLAAEADE